MPKITRYAGETQMLAVGPLTAAGSLPYIEGVEMWFE
jgi:hypothetical protein